MATTRGRMAATRGRMPATRGRKAGTRGRTARLVLAGGMALVAAGCLDATDVPETLLWEGPLLVLEETLADMSGSAAMVAALARTEVGIGIEGAPANATFGWVVRTGTCSLPESAVAPANTFAAVEVSADGIGEAGAVIQRRLSGMEYAVELIENADGSGAVLACADLVRRT